MILNAIYIVSRRNSTEYKPAKRRTNDPDSTATAQQYYNIENEDESNARVAQFIQRLTEGYSPPRVDVRAADTEEEDEEEPHPTTKEKEERPQPKCQEEGDVAQDEEDSKSSDSESSMHKTLSRESSFYPYLMIT
ncbi:Hypothetical predicted protein [Paramuricea clavata]|uniref:Uncharacterized protein n=1 Tax=Paramuricea clavata TaxID=317549 RepID=A0A7D9HTT5_PARCT|nr:Hypothetical predicted protein [Paramuricea clavata]